MNIEVSIIITSFAGGVFAIVGFFLKHWFTKLSVSQDKIIDQMNDQKEHRATASVKLESLKEQNESAQKRMFREMGEIALSMNTSMDKLMVKTERNSMDILNLQNENKFIAKEILQIRRDTNKKDVK
jgi:cupin superfamily acireductone dioxygenase involved in methionine salvage